MDYKIISYEKLDSTNNRAKELALFENEGTVVIAEEQSSGRGRMGRTWLSSKGKSLTMSIILKPDIMPREVSKITLIGGAAVYLGLLDLGIETKIKWPNDIFLKGKKVCGILSEMTCSFDRVKYVVMGIGINVGQDKEDIAEDLMDIATSIKIEGKNNSRIDQVQERVLSRFKELYIPFRARGDLKRVLEITRENSLILGKEIQVINGDKIRQGLALDIDHEGQLLVEFEEGIERIFHGQVSVRLE